MVNKEKAAEMYVELNKLTVEFSMRALRGCLMLNGGAVSAIILLKATEYIVYAAYFGFGAFFAVLGSGFGYLANYYLAETWHTYIEDFSSEPNAEYYGKVFKQLAQIFGFLSIIVFGMALFCLWCDVYNKISTAQ
jgi:membrane protein YqaA with SNARE-associated domain